MDKSDTYYTLIILDSRIKGELFLAELEDKNNGRDITSPSGELS